MNPSNKKNNKIYFNEACFKNSQSYAQSFNLITFRNKDL